MVKRYRQSTAAAAVLAVLCGMLACASAVQAQSKSQTLPGVIDRSVPVVPLPPPPQALPPLVGPPPAPESVPDANAPVPMLTKVNFVGNGVLPLADLEAAAKPYLNRKLTRGDLAQLKYEITRLYYNAGYILVRVVTPPQDLSGGVLNIHIYEAKIERIDADTKGVVHPFIVRGITSQVAPGSVFNETDIESMVRDLDDLHGVKARVDLRPGSQMGTTDLNVVLDKDHDFQQQVSVNNYGSKPTGRWLFNANLQYGNLLGLGELYTLDMSHSNESLYTVRGGIAVPTGLSNTVLDTSYLYSNSDVTGSVALPGTNGTTNEFRLGLSSALLNTARERITLRLGFDGRHHESHFLGNITQSDDQVREFTLDANYLLRLADTTLFASLQLVQGADFAGASHRGDQFLSRADGDPTSFMVRPTLFVRQNLWTDGAFRGLISAQYSPDIVLASDLFSLGGYGSVRGFEPGEATGESGIQFSFAYEHILWQRDGWSVVAGPWVDGGHVWNFVPGASLDESLYSFGGGLELHTNATTIGDSALRFDWAHPVGGYQDKNVSSDTFYLQLLQTF